jgi:hypothetical protein
MLPAANAHPITAQKPPRANALLPVPEGELRVAARPPSAGRPIRLSLIIPTYNVWNFWLNTRLSWRVTEARAKAHKLTLVSSAPDVTANPPLDYPAS